MRLLVASKLSKCISRSSRESESERIFNLQSGADDAGSMYAFCLPSEHTTLYVSSIWPSSEF